MAPPSSHKIPWPSIVLLLAFLAFSLWGNRLLLRDAPKELDYSELLTLIDQGHVKEVEIDETSLHAQVQTDSDKQAKQVIVTRIPALDAASLLERLEAHKVKFRGEIHEASWFESVVSWLLPLVIIVGLWTFLAQRASARGGPLNFGRSRTKIYDRAKEERVTFDDVAGVDEAEAELVEVVDFLKRPEKYQALGARIPKGVLLLGPPGTGKTLLARAVAGEAAVPFFSISGSDFVEMFVGVGAARVRDLFEQAKQRAPCMVFIDELDAIGKTRGGLATMSSNEEREQTLNQLLVEMDGFDARSGVIIMAATNRPEILDPALVRAGRFDRQVLVDRPDVKGREAILRVHARKVRLAPDVELAVIAQRTPGMVGADLANLINEGALSAARRGGDTITHKDLEESIDRIQLGVKKKNRVMSQEETRRVAHHEAGHALVALSVSHADPVHRVTIIPRSVGALGATLQLPVQERYLMTRDELVDRICVMLGGRAAEQLVFGGVSTGAQNDLERATETARQMMCRFGMSARLGPVTYGKAQGLRYLEAPVSFGEERNFSEETARTIDQEVRELVESQYERARGLLTQKRTTLDALAGRLLKVETLERKELEQLFNANAQPS